MIRNFGFQGRSTGGIALCVLGLLSLLISAKATAAEPVADPEVFELTSRQGEAYRIFLSRPQVAPPENGFPVIYVLDGNAHFPTAVDACRKAKPTLPPAVIVGVGYPTDERFDRARRTYDLTTPASPEKLPPTRIPGGWPRSGGADAFLNFLEDELKPQIAKKVSIDRNRQTLVGHSFGGLFTMHTLFTRPESFQTYVAISPSGWWNDYALRKEEKRFAAEVNRLKAPARLLIAVGELELKGDVGPTASLDPTPASEAFGTTRDFAQRLGEIESPQLDVSYHEFAGENHGSVVPPALNVAMLFILK